MGREPRWRLIHSAAVASGLLETVAGVSVLGQPYADILAKLKDGAYSDVQISCLHTLRDCT